MFFSIGRACLLRFFVDTVAGRRHELSRWNLGNTAEILGVICWHWLRNTSITARIRGCCNRMSACILVQKCPSIGPLKYCLLSAIYNVGTTAWGYASYLQQSPSACGGQIVQTLDLVDFSRAVLLSCNVDGVRNRACLSWYIIGRQNLGTKAWISRMQPQQQYIE